MEGLYENPEAQFLKWKQFIKILLPFCGFKYGAIGKRLELSQLTHMVSRDVSYNDSDDLNDEQITKMYD